MSAPDRNRQVKGLSIDEPSISYDWLLNSPIDDCWYLKPYLPGQDRSSYTVNWNSVFTVDNTPVSKWTYWKEYGKALSISLMESTVGRSIKTGTAACYFREIRSICSWFCFEAKCLSVATVSKAIIEEYIDYLGGLTLSKSTIETKLLVLRKMWLCSKVVGDGLTFDPFPRNGNIGGAAKRISKHNGHTDTLYPPEYFKLLNAALEKLYEYKLTTEKLDYYIKCKSQYSDYSAAFKRVYSEGSHNLHKECQVLYASAIVVILSLLGERKHELHSHSVDNVEAILKSEYEYLVGKEYKLSGSEVGQTTERSFVPEIPLAFSVIRALTKHSPREENSDSFLLKLVTRDNVKDESRQFNLGTRTLYSMLDALKAEVGFEGRLRPHIFRRSFALLWAWRFELGDHIYLAKILRHKNFDGTRIYTRDESIWSFFGREGKELVSSVLESAFLEPEGLRGGFSRSIKRYSKILRAKFSAVSPKHVSNFVETLIARTNTVMIPNADGYCFINKNRARYAKCSTDKEGPNYSNRSESKCAKCPNFAVNETRSSYWEERYRAHKLVCDSTDIKLLRESSIKGMAICEKFIWKSTD